MVRRRSVAFLLPLLLLACGGRAEESAPETPGASGGEQAPQSPDSGPPGGQCTYREIPGTATVTALEAFVDNSPTGACYRARTRLTFTFTADDPSLLPTPAANQPYLGPGDAVPTSCLEPAGIHVGSTFAVIRREQVVGTCSPLIYDVPKTSTARICVCTPCDTGTAVCF
jgi:hypothetical protein